MFKAEKYDLKDMLPRVPIPEVLPVFGFHDSDGSLQFRNNLEVEGRYPIGERCRFVRSAIYDGLHAES